LALSYRKKEQGEYIDNVVGWDLGLKFFTKDQNDNAVIYPGFLRKAQKQLKKAQRRLSKKSENLWGDRD
jgi:putative transposase